MHPSLSANTTIAEQIASGIPSAVITELILDPEKAIETAIRNAKFEDVVLIAGKGHETTQEVSGTTLPFSDQTVVRALLTKLGRVT